MKAKIDAELAKSHEDFIEHFRNTYSNSYPPAWMLAEILPLGVLDRIYGNIKSNQIRKEIAQECVFCIPTLRECYIQTSSKPLESPAHLQKRSKYIVIHCYSSLILSNHQLPLCLLRLLLRILLFLYLLCNLYLDYR